MKHILHIHDGHMRLIDTLEITEWVDDGKSEVGFSVDLPDGQRLECLGTMPKAEGSEKL